VCVVCSIALVESREGRDLLVLTNDTSSLLDIITNLCAANLASCPNERFIDERDFKFELLLALEINFV